MSPPTYAPPPRLGDRGGRKDPLDCGHRKVETDLTRGVRQCPGGWLGPVATCDQLEAAGYDPRDLKPGDFVDVPVEPNRRKAGLARRVAVLEVRCRELSDLLDRAAIA